MEKEKIRIYLNNVRDIINLTNACKVIENKTGLKIDRSNLQKFLNGNDNVLKQESLDSFYEAFQMYIINPLIKKSTAIDTKQIVNELKKEIIAQIENLDFEVK